MDTLLKLAHNIKIRKCLIGLLCGLWGILSFSACSPDRNKIADKLNETAYAYHYRNIDSTDIYAYRALKTADNYDAGRAEAYNNLAFSNIARMNYQLASQQLDSAISATDNQIELMVAEIQYMRLCQRQSHNKSFYDHQMKAKRCLDRIDEEKHLLDGHQIQRFAYAESEYYINLSIYYYYVGLIESSIAMIQNIDAEGDIKKDTAQYLNYLYNVGAGGIVTGADAEDLASEEFEYLAKCFLLAQQKGYIYWEAQALQAISEHLLVPATRQTLFKTYRPFLDYINTDQVADSLLAGNLALRSLYLFTQYHDVYQTAGSYRTLASCYWEIQDYQSSMLCLDRALETDTIINRAPDLVASIREQMCLVYSAQNDKHNSDINRNYYLDIQEQTRQDKQLEARADMLSHSSQVLNVMIMGILILTVCLIYVLVYFTRKRKLSNASFDIEKLLEPLNRWSVENNAKRDALDSRLEELDELTVQVMLEEKKNKQRNLEQRAKVALANSIMPFIDRIINELNRLKRNDDSPEVVQERYEYVRELTDTIDNYNLILTKWIKIKQGRVSLRIESFCIGDVLDIVAKAKMSFAMKGVELVVLPSDAVVKADKVLTLFMVNTMADNARKFTPDGGTVKIQAQEYQDYVELSVEDTGCGMNETQITHLLDNKRIVDDGSTSASSHGFGLLNCKGIIENYKKTSRIFSVCDIFVSSEPGKGSRFAFRLPKGIYHMITIFATLLFGFTTSSFANGGKAQKAGVTRLKTDEPHLYNAAKYADSAYISNIQGTYLQTLAFADSCIKYLNLHNITHADGRKKMADMVMFTESTAIPPEIEWFHNQCKTDYAVILDIRNETAVAALALHKWKLYKYNNNIYTRLFHECYADTTLPQYVLAMQKAENNKWVAIVILILLLSCILPLYYIVYYRHVIYYRTCIGRIHVINQLLEGNASDEEKLMMIENCTKSTGNLGIPVLDDVVNKILTSLKNSSETAGNKAEQIEFANDNLKKIERESNMLYIRNSVLDNCLSALKHETMYFPSRIKQLADENEGNIDEVAEIAAYYKQLYTILCMQAMRQIEDTFRVDKETIDYLFELLKKANQGMAPKRKVIVKDNNYVKIECTMCNLHLDSMAAQRLFTPQTTDYNFLICRQIIRELGEMTNMRGCGISMSENNIIEITIPKTIWKNLMS